MSDSEPRLSSTIVVTRDGDAGLEVLLLERSGARKPWVFPGGKLDEADRVFECLREAMEQRRLMYPLTDPDLERYRSDPRLIAIAQQMGLEG